MRKGIGRTTNLVPPSHYTFPWTGEKLSARGGWEQGGNGPIDERAVGQFWHQIWYQLEIKRKRFFLFLPIAERTWFKNVNFCRYRYSAESASFCRKSVFLPKECPSAEIVSFCRASWCHLEPLWRVPMDTISLPKYVSYAEIECLCR